MNKTISKTIDSTLLHSMVIGIGLIFTIVRRLDAHFYKAISHFEATYEFRAGFSTRQLLFRNGNIQICASTKSQPDYAMVFLDLHGILRRLAHNPNDVLQLLLENKIEGIGNIYYLQMLGYLSALCVCRIQELILRVRSLAAHA